MNNLELDNELKSGVISPEGFRKLLDAEVYGTATPMQWLEKRLLIIVETLKSDASIYYNTGQETGKLDSIESFAKWCSKKLPDAYKCFIEGKHL
jgi:hypothetical protein